MIGKNELLTYNFDVIVFVEHYVLGLKISVHDLLLTEIVEDADNLGGKEAYKSKVKFPYTKRDQSRQE